MIRYFKAGRENSPPTPEDEDFSLWYIREDIITDHFLHVLEHILNHPVHEGARLFAVPDCYFDDKNGVRYWLYVLRLLWG
jgi:hypothetical protein